MGLYQTSDEQKVRLYEIATSMEKAGLPDKFIACAVEIGLYYGGVFDLFELWAEEGDGEEREQILSDIQEEINEFKEHLQEHYMNEEKIKPCPFCGSSNILMSLLLARG